MRLIDADKLLARLKARCAGCKETKNYCEHCCDIADVIDDIEDAPTEDVVERKIGTWIDDDGLYVCSSCNKLWAHWWANAMPPERLYKEMKYCPRCGAEMRKEKTNEPG